MGRSCMLLFILMARGLDIGQVRYVGQWEGKWAHRAYARLLQECTCTGEMVVVHRGFLRCSIEHEGGPVVTEGRVTEALQCSRFLLSLPGYPCPRILAVGISYHDGGNGSRSPPIPKPVISFSGTVGRPGIRPGVRSYIIAASI